MLGRRAVIFGCLIICTTGCGIEQVNEGFRGIKTHWGRVVGEPLSPGLYFYNPIPANIFEMDVREHKFEKVESAFTKDTQTVAVTFVVTLYPQPEKIGLLYSQFGKAWEEKIVTPVTVSSIKDVIGQFVADELIASREGVQKAVFDELRESLKSRYVIVTRFDLTNLDFNDGYENAVEAKVVAVQRAAEARNKTVQVEEEAKQKVASARADAESMRIKSQALSQNKSLINYEIATRWNGVLPGVVLGNSIPLLNFENLQKH